jgi:sugar lactone lactonase YvrE
MANNVNPDGSPGHVEGSKGALFRIDPDGAASEWKHDIGIANTMVWTPDHTRFYSVDTRKNIVFVYDYDMKTGAISNERPFFAGFDRGVPDGSNIDSEGFLWNCRHGGGCVVRVAPDGQIDRVIDILAKNPTSCTFGGSDYRTLYVTSAGIGAPPGDRWGGSVFAIESSVPGLPENRFRIG